MLLLFGSRGDVNLSASLLRIGSIAIVFFALSTITNGVLQGIDKLKLPVRHAAISLAVHIPIVYVLIRFFKLDAYGLVIGNISFAAMVCILNWRAVAKHLNYRQEVIRTFMLPSVASLVMGIAGYYINDVLYRLTGSNSLSVIISILFSVLVYGVLVILLRTVSEEELIEMPKGRTLLRLFQKLHLM